MTVRPALQCFWCRREVTHVVTFPDGRDLCRGCELDPTASRAAADPTWARRYLDYWSRSAAEQLEQLTLGLEGLA